MSNATSPSALLLPPPPVRAGVASCRLRPAPSKLWADGAATRDTQERAAYLAILAARLATGELPIDPLSIADAILRRERRRGDLPSTPKER